MKLFVGLDVSLAKTLVCVISEHGKIIKEAEAQSESGEPNSDGAKSEDSSDSDKKKRGKRPNRRRRSRRGKKKSGDSPPKSES